MTRARRALGAVAYGLAPRWLAAVMVAFDAVGEARAATRRP